MHLKPNRFGNTNFTTRGGGVVLNLPLVHQIVYDFNPFIEESTL